MTASAQPQEPKKENKLLKWLGWAILVFFLLYLLSDRFFPYSSEGRVRGFVVPLSSQVAGRISNVAVQPNHIVQQDEVVIEIDKSDFELAVTRAQADLDLATQQQGINTSEVVAAQARYLEAQSNLKRVEEDAGRIIELASRGLIAKRDADAAETRLANSRSKLIESKALLDKAEQELGATDASNPEIQAALSALRDAQLDLLRTDIRAPSLGVVSNASIDQGQYAKVGEPLMVFLSTRFIWVEAYLRENNLERIKPGDQVDILLDASPGQLFRGEVESIGYGIDWGQNQSNAKLPSVTTQRGWLRDAQRFPVIIRFPKDMPSGLRRVGGQVDVVVYTNENFMFRMLGQTWMRILSWLSYLY